jgi:Protein of unknown function (DUF2490)
MQGFTRFALQLVPGLLVIGLVSLGRPCVAQEVDGPGAGARAGSVFAPSGYLGLIVPVQDRIGLRLYGWYIGELKAPGVTAELPIRTTNFLTITPGYQYMEMPPSGIDNYVDQPGGFTETYQEHQFRIDGTFKFFIHKLEITDRNMYVRRFRPTWVGDDINRYRNRIGLAHPLAVMGEIWKPFASFEAYFDEGHSGSVRNRVWVGVNVPLQKQVVFQPGYIWENNRVRGVRDVNYLLFALIVSPK